MYEGHADIIYSKDIDTRIRELADRPYEDSDLNDDEELRDLTRFRKRVADTFGMDAWTRGISLVAASYTDQYADDQADDLFGEDTTSQRAWHAEEWREDFYEHWSGFTLNGTEYWTNGDS